jgi:hypothetical protein
MYYKFDVPIVMPALCSISGVANTGHVQSVDTEIVYGDRSKIYILKTIFIWNIHINVFEW